MATITLNGVRKDFRLQDTSITALANIQFDVGEKEFVSLIGPSGCGKSTVLRLIAGLVQPTSGEITVHGLSPAEARRRQLYAFVFQDPVLFPWRSVMQNVALPLEIAGTGNRKTQAAKVKALLALVGLEGFENAAPDQLSGGMKHRAAIARALLLEPPVLLMDEPFGALDEITRDHMNLELLRIWDRTSASVLFVTHSIEEAIFLSDRIIMLSPRPATVAAEIRVDLPRPRTLALKQSEEAFAYSAMVRKKLTQITMAADSELGSQSLG